MNSLNDERKEITFEIEAEPYTLFATLHDLLYTKAELPDETFDFRKYTSDQIVNCITNPLKPTVEQIEAQNDQFFENIFDQFLGENTEFYIHFAQCECDEICKRYTLAYRHYLIDLAIDKAAQIPNVMTTAITEMVEKTTSVMQNINFDYLNSIAETVGKAMSWYADNATRLIGGITSALETLSKISERLLSGISDFITEIDVPEYTEEEKKQLIVSYKQWGKFGWTIPPSSYIDSFNNCPDTLAEADKFALQFCTQKDMDDLFCSLETLCKRKKDLREAIACYKHRHYKACALILFSLIDSRVIRLQGKKEKYGVGIGAIIKFKQVAKQKTTNESRLYLALCYENIFPCLFAMFDDTDNFTKKQPIINRNYLDHGMSCKTVRKKDCIKLFLLLYNMLAFIDIIK